MSVIISGVEKGSVAGRHGFAPGDRLTKINGREIGDVLDYRFHMTNSRLTVEGFTADGEPFSRDVAKGEYDDLGLLFDTFLMDKQRGCKNKCVFCFIDQMPEGMRESLYFKDDDSRMSFLFGNYITLTNLEERDIERILEMHISPVNISVHTMNPALRVEMMKNPRAGEVLRHIPRLAAGGIKINAQLVLCPGRNDGPELERSLRELCALAPGLQSLAVVPVGLTRHREGLPALRLFTAEEAGAVIDQVERWGGEMLAAHGQRICFASDEFYLCAGRELPAAAFYEDFAQLENGVGMLPLLLDEFSSALSDWEEDATAVSTDRAVTLATGAAAAPFLERLARRAETACPGLSVRVVTIANHFFGETITVAGLVTGGDLIGQLEGLPTGEELLLPAAMLRHEGDLFLDGVSLEQVAERLSLPVRAVPNDGYELLDAILGRTL